MATAGADPLFPPKTRAADQGGVVVDGVCPEDGGADHLSDLPDHLLHRILIRLPSTAAAARTSVLSRRWRRVWLHLPELALRYGGRDREPSSPCPRVDAALAACAAPALDRLEIDLTWSDPRHVTAEHASSWLDFASRRLAGELVLSLPLLSRSVKRDVVLPISERLTAISLTSFGYALRFRAPLPSAAAGAFAALGSLTISDARVDGRELVDVVSSRCPRLKELALDHIIVEDRDHPVLSVRSASLERLRVRPMFNGDRLQVSTPELRALDLPEGTSCAAHIVAPKLSEVRWGKQFYDPSRHKLEGAGRHLRRLEVAANSRAAGIMGRFDTADELTLNISVSKGVDEYERFLEDTKKVAKCEVLVARFTHVMVHDFRPILLHLLRKCSGIRKLVVQLGPASSDYPCELPRCPCGLLHNHYPTYGVDVLGSLQEVQVEKGGEAHHKLELAGLLCRCKAIFQKKVFITIPVDKRNPLMRRRIDRVFLPNDDRVEVAIVEVAIH
ncbi:unnamed protein product [Urochloa decumbens]|uniref:F-box domain-containing protein n=1 Tax=Urochloa decumbens TaxID=240449 RepID=A0ABC9G2R6_9POAL